ncbi:MAG: TIGR04222 domain-containing membrane protein [Acidobacteriota bacterium]
MFYIAFGRSVLWLLYPLACLVVIVLVYVQRVVSESVSELTKFDTSDPYRLAYLRGGSSEAMRAATALLIEKGYLMPLQNESSESTEKLFVIAPGCDVKSLSSPVEKAVLGAFTAPAKPETMFRQKAPKQQMDDLYKEGLKKAGLLPSETQKRFVQIGAVFPSPFSS